MKCIARNAPRAGMGTSTTLIALIHVATYATDATSQLCHRELPALEHLRNGFHLKREV